MGGGVLALAVMAGGVRGADAPEGGRARPTHAAVEQSIAKAVDYLLAQRKNGRWEINYKEGEQYYGGETALVTYALLTAGKGSDDKRLTHTSDELKPAIEFLLKLEPKSTYVAALQACALGAMPRQNPPPRALVRARDLLMASRTAEGGYGYTATLDPKTVAGDGADLSNSQMAVLGMWAVAEGGVVVPGHYWNQQDEYWRKAQTADGGFPYRVGGGATVSMTAAGAATLFITGDATWTVSKLNAAADTHLDNALAWLGKNVKFEDATPYTLYSIERVGLAGGTKYLGKHDWFKEGAAILLEKQRPNGMWDMHVHGVDAGHIVTPFNLIFLVRGRHPVVFNKLQYEGAWNARPRDDAHLTAYLSREYERPLNWQTVNLEVEAQEWTDAPILLITGQAAPAFTPEQVAKLKEYVELGGLIFSTTMAGGEAFDEAVEKLMVEVAGGRAVRDLPADHPIYTIHTRFKEPPALRGVNNGVRELWVHSKEDLPATWQTRNLKKPLHWELPANLYFYTRGKVPLRSRLQTLAVPVSTQEPARTVAVGRLKYDGNWDPEPGAWRRFARLAAAEFNTKVEVTTVEVADLDAAKQRIVFVTGTDALAFSDEEVAKIKAFVDAGGVVWADAANSSEAFGKSAEALAKQVAPAAKLELLPLDQNMFTQYVPEGQEVKEIEVRPFTALKRGRFTQPKVLGARSGGRFLMVFTPTDVHSGWLGHQTWGTDGYMPASAEKLGRNMLMALWVEGERVRAREKREVRSQKPE